MTSRNAILCEENAIVKDRCPLLVPGGVQCKHRATVVPQDWELPPYCVPGKAVCFCCYLILKKHACYSQSLRSSPW